MLLMDCVNENINFEDFKKNSRTYFDSRVSEKVLDHDAVSAAGGDVQG